MQVDELLPYLKENQEELIQKIRMGRYKPNPVRRVEIPKEEKGKVRKLGIPTVSANCTEIQRPFGKCHNYTSVSSIKWPKLYSA